MPKFRKYIQQPPSDYGAALKISGFYVANESANAPTQEPFAYNAQLPIFSSGEGISPDVNVASGEFFIGDPLIKWNLVNPSDNSVFDPNDLYNLTAFSGFEVNLRNETGALVRTFYTGGYKGNQIELNAVIRWVY